MITINCSLAAAEFLYKGFKKGNDEGFFVDAGALPFPEFPGDRGHGQSFHWVVHAIKLGRSTCLIAMDSDTRYCHVIHQAKKGDVQDVLHRLLERFINGIVWQCQYYSLCDASEMKTGIDRFLALYGDLRFSQRIDKSVMAHINQVAVIYRDQWHELGFFPDDEETALHFDLELNQDFRACKGEKFGPQVNVKMLERWLTNFMHFSPQRISDALTLIQKIEREKWQRNLAEPHLRSDT